MTQAYSDPSRENHTYALPDVEIFYRTEAENLADGWLDESDSTTVMGAGWYYWFCFPGCMPDSEAIGPFENEDEALNDARDY